jgi:hypothetical protein
MGLAMSPVPINPRRVFGVDFSAAPDAGRRIWVCRGHPGADGVRIESIDRLCDLPGGAVKLQPALRSLVSKVLESPRSAWGFDFPFSLPRTIAEALTLPLEGDWSRLLEAVARLPGAGELRRRALEAGRGRQLWRRTDAEAATGLSPYDRRVHGQTFHGLTGILWPLRGSPEIAVLPFDPLPEPGAEKLPFNRAASKKMPHVYLMEVRPPAVLVALGYPRGYRGSGEAEVAGRRRILRSLIDDGLVRPAARGVRTRILDDGSGHALDAVLAAVGAWRGYRLYAHATLRDDPFYATEGFVYT